MLHAALGKRFSAVVAFQELQQLSAFAAYIVALAQGNLQLCIRRREIEYGIYPHILPRSGQNALYNVALAAHLLYRIIHHCFRDLAVAVVFALRPLVVPPASGDGSGMVLHLDYEDSGMAHYKHVKF